MIAKVNEFFHVGIENVGELARLRIHFDAFWSQRQRCAVPAGVYVNFECLDSGAAIGLDLAVVAVNRGHLSRQRVVLTDKLRNECVVGSLVQICWGGQLFDDAFIEYADSIRHRECFRLIVGDVDHRDFKIIVDMFYLVLHLFTKLFVKCTQGLIHKNQFGIKYQCARDRHPLLLAAGELAGSASTEAAKANHIQCTFDTRFDFIFVDAADLKWKRKVFINRHVWKEGIVLKDHTNPSTMWRDSINRPTIQIDFAMGCGLEACKHHQTGGFT